MTRYGALVVCLGLLATAHHAVTAQAPVPSGSPQVASVSPASGSGAGRTFTFVFSDPQGGSDISTTEGLVVSGTQVVGTNACYFFASGNQFFLRNDAHTAWLGPVTSGTSGMLSNAQCALFAAGSSTSASGTSATMTVTLTFTIPFAGAKTVFAKATDRGGLTADWTRAGDWTVAPLAPSMDVVTSSCADASREDEFGIALVNEPGGQGTRQVTTPTCFPSYSFLMEGLWINNRQAVATMGRTLGHFNILVAFTDTDFNRKKLLDNPVIPQGAKNKIADGRVKDGLVELFASYTTTDIMSGFLQPKLASLVDFTFTIALTPAARQAEEVNDFGLGFANYDAVILLDDLVTASGMGIRRWPTTRPLFNARNAGYILYLDPFRITPGVFGNELLRRNLPVLLSEYVMGPSTLVRENGVLYDRTPVINPRTGENIEPLIRAYEGKISLGVYLAGYADVDGDGVIDAVDPFITPTPDNVDGDFLPDRLDPDLNFKHRVYSWLYAPRPGR